jgi:hypothetical protein
MTFPLFSSEHNPDKTIRYILYFDEVKDYWAVVKYLGTDECKNLGILAYETENNDLIIKATKEDILFLKLRFKFEARVYTIKDQILYFISSWFFWMVEIFIR